MESLFQAIKQTQFDHLLEDLRGLDELAKKVQNNADCMASSKESKKGYVFSEIDDYDDYMKYGIDWMVPYFMAMLKWRLTETLLDQECYFMGKERKVFTGDVPPDDYS